MANKNNKKPVETGGAAGAGPANQQAPCKNPPSMSTGAVASPWLGQSSTSGLTGP
jgi:hypothetical protein